MRTQHLKKEDLILKSQRKQIVIDVAGMSMGRAATQVATLLMGKNDPQYSPFLIQFSRRVRVKNLKDIILTGKKLENKVYYKHTGYVGNLKEIPLYREFEKSPEKVFRRAVMRMLPKNKLQSKMIKNLTFNS